MEKIDQIEVSDRFKKLWNIEVYDYNYNGKNCDLQDLLVAIANNRAAKIEAEITPQSVRMRSRNKFLEQLGNALSELSAIQTSFKSEAKGTDREGYTSKEVTALMITLGASGFKGETYNPTKAETEGAIQKVKTKMDALNNQAQTDMTRLQGLVDKRDESFTASSNLMSGVSDTRGNLIKNLN